MAETGDSLLHRVSRMSFSAAEKRVIELLLSIAEYDVAGLPSSAIAEKTGTSRSTVDRLCRRLGYGGLKELRRALLQESRSMQGPVSAGSVSGTIAHSDSFSEIAYKVFHSASVRALRFADLLSHSSELDRLVMAIREAKSIQVFGVGASAVVALDMHQRLMRLGIRISFSDDHHNQIAGASLMEPGDLAIAISYSGRTRQTVHAATIARARGATIAAILGVPGSALEEIVDIPIITPPGINLFGADAVMTRALEIMFNEVLFHCLAFGDARMMQNVSRIEEDLRGERA
ncbi:MurR/RpiR family transcriptional regulator [Ensifer soli]|uniref:MurR/RpiR family transcriptional regulator n=1 Tax=Ciceribacter sp. sgz301302 TaxID=3342379 RepID=UPI0035B6E6F5